MKLFFISFFSNTGWTYFREEGGASSLANWMPNHTLLPLLLLTGSFKSEFSCHNLFFYCFITIVNSHNIQDSPFSDGHRGEELGDKAGDGGGEGEDPVDGGLHHLPGGPSNISQET